MLHALSTSTFSVSSSSFLLLFYFYFPRLRHFFRMHAPLEPPKYPKLAEPVQATQDGEDIKEDKEDEHGAWLKQREFAGKIARLRMHASIA